MKELRLPVIKSNFPSSKVLSMDDYLRFVILNLKYVVNDRNRKHGEPINAGTPFKI